MSSSITSVNRNKLLGLDVPFAMRHVTVTIPAGRGVDWKGLGYLVSIVSVFFLGAVAWPKDNPPWWYYPALVVGMITSIVGMAFRYMAHRAMQREVRKAEAKAERG
jgi:protein-S-isoprenylcysteine O-methyltransferase Ste14